MSFFTTLANDLSVCKLHLKFIVDVLDTFAKHDDCDEVWWRCDGEYAPVTFFINCNDFFWWGTGDSERLTPENIAVLKQAYVDCIAAGDKRGAWAGLLFCARVRQLRPQGCCYPKEKAIAALFDACGPKRDVDLGNPYSHPEDGGKFEYKSETTE